MLIKIHRTVNKNTLRNIKLIGKILVDFIIYLFQSPGSGLILVYSFNNNVSMDEQV